MLLPLSFRRGTSRFRDRVRAIGILFFRRGDLFEDDELDETPLGPDRVGESKPLVDGDRRWKWRNRLRVRSSQ